MREAVRSGRRAPFFMTENRFIDCYAAKVGGSGVAVYSILQRCANSETRETFISVPKMAKVLDIDKSTVYRRLEDLEKLRLIKRYKTREKTTYVVLPVPPPPAEVGSTPLFDAIDAETAGSESIWPPVVPMQMSPAGETDSHLCNDSVAQVQQPLSPVQSIGRAGKNRNKEEQDLLNKTQEQDLFNKPDQQEKSKIKNSAQRIISILGISDEYLHAAAAAVEDTARRTKLSADGIVLEIVTAANQAERRGIEKHKFLEDFLAQSLAESILEKLSLPVTNNLISTVKAAVKAEATYTKLPLEKVAALIASAAIEDRRRGITIDRFYFENVKWRSNAKVSKAEQRKLDNLEVNARVKQRLRERFGTS